MVLLQSIKLASGSAVGQVCRSLGITEQTHYRRRKSYSGMQVSQAKKQKALEQENARLKKLVADQALDKAILEEAFKGNYRAPSDAAEQCISSAR